jgi:hypothetical protein
LNEGWQPLRSRSGVMCAVNQLALNSSGELLLLLLGVRGARARHDQTLTNP